MNRLFYARLKLVCLYPLLKDSAILTMLRVVSVCEADCSNSTVSVWFGLVIRVKRRVVSEDVLAGTEIPGGWGRGRLFSNTRRSQEVGEEGDYFLTLDDPRRLGKRETIF